MNQLTHTPSDLSDPAKPSTFSVTPPAPSPTSPHRA